MQLRFWMCISQRFYIIISIQGCLMTSCLNGGSCLPENENQTFSCSCQQPWTGDRCEIKKGNSEFYFIYHLQSKGGGWIGFRIDGFDFIIKSDGGFFARNREDVLILKTQRIVDQLWILVRISDCACQINVQFLVWFGNLDLSSALVGMLISSTKLFLFSNEAYLNSSVVLLLELHCVIVIKNVAFFTIFANLRTFAQKKFLTLIFFLKFYHWKMMS